VSITNINIAVILAYTAGNVSAVLAIQGRERPAALLGFAAALVCVLLVVST
jgi:hypothetical protein